MLDRLPPKMVRICLILLVLLVVCFAGRIAYDIYREQGEWKDIKQKTNLTPNEPLR